MDNYNYPEGSDNADAPWNQKDIEVNDDHMDEAYKIIAPIMEWEPYTKDELINALEYIGTEEACEAIDVIFHCSKPNPGMAIREDLRAIIETQAEDFQKTKAQEIAEDSCI